jgi:hypothetical protein
MSRFTVAPRKVIKMQFKFKKILFFTLFASKKEKNNTPLKVNKFESVSDKAPDEDTNQAFIDSIIGSIDGVDLCRPPGLAGDICHDVELFEHRELPELRPLVAISAMSFLSHHVQCFGGGNLRTFALGIAPSGAGKEAHQAYLKMVMTSANLTQKVIGKPRSDKNIYLDVVECEEGMYLIDEVHSFFKQGTSQSASSFESGMISVLLELSTTESFVFPSKILNELKKKYQNELVLMKAKEGMTQKAVVRLERILKRLTDGWEEPFVQFTGYSTPINMKKIYNKINIEQGLIARIFTFLAPEKRAKYTGRVIQQPSPQIIERLNKLLKNDTSLKISNNAKKYLESLSTYFELDEVLNHPHLGALYARGRKMILLIASILAVEEREIQYVYLQYAFALFLFNVRSCEKFFMPGNTCPIALLKEAKRVVTNQLSKHTLSKSQLANKMTQCSHLIKEHHGTNRKVCYELIDKLCSDGLIEVRDKTVYLAKEN